ncbi:MAG: potassium transporter TrkG, partial [Thermoguttaceae bacterium]
MSFLKKIAVLKGRVRSKLILLTPFQLLSLGFFTYVIAGTIVISLPFSQLKHVDFVDNLFNVVSAMSTTGLTVGAVGDIYTFWGNLVLLVLMQLGAIGYMTFTSFLILARGDRLSPTRKKILGAEFTLPEGFAIRHFTMSVIIYSFIIESIGTIVLWYEFDKFNVDNPLWQAAFHSVSAFATAGFSLFVDGLEPFRDNFTINITILVLSYFGAIGFIVPADIFGRLTGLRRNVTLTTK